MKRLFVAALALAGLPAAVSAQDQHVSDLNEVIVSASPLEEQAAGINQAVSVLSGEELRNKAAATIGESLKDEPGVTSSGFGPGVGKPVIRGQNGGRVRVMQDSLGTMDASTASGDHSIAIEALVAERAGKPMSLPQYLAREHGALWLKYQVGAPADDPYRVIEAIGEGVVPNTFGHAIGDSLAALRPTLGKRRKAEAILDAFAQVGKPYDFDFDFATEHALVCTELVWRAYRPVGDGEGLTFPLEKIAGRRTLPANVIAREFDASMERGDPQLDFVLFYDGDEKARRAVRSDLDAFRASHTRQKWL